MNVKTCISCKQSDEWSVEHCLPRGLGNFKDPLTLPKTICNKCNNIFSKSEGQFLKVSPVGFFRHLLGIKGYKHHSTGKPFYQRVSGTSPITIKFPHPEHNLDIYWGFKSGTNDLYELNQIIMKKKNGCTVPISFSEIPNSAEELLELISSYNLCDAEPVFFHVQKEDWNNFINLLKEIWTNKEIDELPNSKTNSKIKAPIHISVTSLYFRAVAKIGFHYFLNVFSHKFSGEEPEFDAIRSFIFEGKGHPKDFVQQTNKQINYEISRGGYTKKWCHYLTAEKTNKYFVSRAQFFIGPLYIPPVHEIMIAPNKSKIIYPENYGHSYTYFPDGPKNSFIGEVKQLKAFRRTLLP